LDAGSDPLNDCRCVDALGAVVSGCAALAVEILRDNGRAEAGAVNGALAMPFATPVGQLFQRLCEETLLNRH
jgi:hypothetical protein